MDTEKALRIAKEFRSRTLTAWALMKLDKPSGCLIQEAIFLDHKVANEIRDALIIESQENHNEESYIVEEVDIFPLRKTHESSQP